MKALQVIESAYRCNIEEQDDPAIWISHAMKGAGAEIGVLLRANSVNYALKGQDSSGLVFGSKRQTPPPQLDRDIRRFGEKSVPVYYIEEDAKERGIDPSRFVEGVKAIKRSEIGKLFADFDQIWHW